MRGFGEDKLILLDLNQASGPRNAGLTESAPAFELDASVVLVNSPDTLPGLFLPQGLVLPQGDHGLGFVPFTAPAPLGSP